MENQTIIELIDKDAFSLPELTEIVYTILEEKSTREYDLTLDNIKCTLLFKKPPYIALDGVNENNYYYFVVEIGDYSGEITS